MIYYIVPQEEYDDTYSLFEYDGKVSRKIFGQSQYLSKFEMSPEALKELMEAYSYKIISKQDAVILTNMKYDEGYDIYHEIEEEIKQEDVIVFLDKNECDVLLSFFRD